MNRAVSMYIMHKWETCEQRLDQLLTRRWREWLDWRNTARWRSSLRNILYQHFSELGQYLLTKSYHTIICTAWSAKLPCTTNFCLPQLVMNLQTTNKSIFLQESQMYKCSECFIVVSILCTCNQLRFPSGSNVSRKPSTKVPLCDEALQPNCSSNCQQHKTKYKKHWLSRLTDYVSFYIKYSINNIPSAEQLNQLQSSLGPSLPPV